MVMQVDKISHCFLTGFFVMLRFWEPVGLVTSWLRAQQLVAGLSAGCRLINCLCGLTSWLQ
jgi:hypothetical protein